MTLRRDPVSGLLAVVAPRRGERPGAFAPASERPVRQRPADCPFCAGHEDQTPPACLTLPEGAGDWRVRVVPNLFPALEDGDGAQEVVVHAPRHAVSLGELGADEVALVAEAWTRRAEARRAEGWAHLFACVNDGPGSGASLDHSHSQLAAFPTAPPLTALRQARFAAATECPLCRVLHEEVRGGSRVVVADDELVVIAPAASALPFQLRAAPVAHHPDGFADPALLARALAAVAAAYARALGTVPWNAWLETAPLAGDRRFHWHVEAFPRLTTLAGLELGAGLPVCPVAPEAAAAQLRG